MLTIWKQVLKPDYSQPIMVPEGAEMLCAREQKGEPCVWFKCDPNKPFVPRKLLMIGTGHATVPENGCRYLGTCHLYDGNLVLHIFELTN